MKILGYDITAKLIKPETRKSPQQYAAKQQKYEFRLDLYSLKVAIDLANNVENYTRYDLHNIYRRAVRDPNLTAQWNTRILKTLDREFKVVKGGKEDPELTKLFEAPWFSEFVKSALAYKMWGFSLLEFGPWDAETRAFMPYRDTTGKYHDAIEEVDRDYVKPEFGLIVNNYNDTKGVSFYDQRIAKNLMFIGSRKDHGMLESASRYILMKDNAQENWSEYGEIFGMDTRVGKTSAQGDDRKAFIQAMRDMGSNGWGVIGEDDEIIYAGVRRYDAFRVYAEFLFYCDEAIAKLIFGQDVITNNTGRVVGKVGENVSNMYGDTDTKLVQWLVNTQLMSFIEEKSGISFKGAEFIYDTTEYVRLYERSKIDKVFIDGGWRPSEDYIRKTYGMDVTRRTEQ